MEATVNRKYLYGEQLMNSMSKLQGQEGEESVGEFVVGEEEGEEGVAQIIVPPEDFYVEHGEGSMDLENRREHGDGQEEHLMADVSIQALEIID